MESIVGLTRYKKDQGSSIEMSQIIKNKKVDENMKKKPLIMESVSSQRY